MTDLDLEKLARRAPPAALDFARADALTAAMRAFDDAEKIVTAPQGSAGGGRRSSIFNRIWSPIMNRRLLAGSALATLLVVPVAGLVTYELVRNGTVPLATETQIAAKPVDAGERARQQEAKTETSSAGELAALQKSRQAQARQDLEAAATAKVAADSAQPTNMPAEEPLAEMRKEEVAAAAPESLAVGGAAATQNSAASLRSPRPSLMRSPCLRRRKTASASPRPIPTR